ncbi:DNA-binding protein, partial [Acinetobacter baumannii]
LRGVKESGIVFAVPTYGFILSMVALIVFGIPNMWGHAPIDPTPALQQFKPEAAAHPFGLLLLLRAFAASCTAMTGVEAISNGVQAFRKPEA